jgi:hypothetical protein
MRSLGRAIVAGAFAAIALMLAGAGFADPATPAGPSASGPKDKAALKLDDEAMGKDYLHTKFAKAEKKLALAIKTCGDKGCSTKVMARLHRDRGVVRLAGLGQVDAGKGDLKTAVAFDPDIELDPDYTTPELTKAFEELHPKPEPQPEEPKPGKKGIAIDEVSEQAVATPVPIFARFGGSAVKLRLTYRGVGGERWRSVDMAPNGEGFAGEIPCAAAPKEGKIAYFIEALGEGEETLDREGSRADPHTVTIVKQLEGDPPHLPDAQPPKRCEDKDLCSGDDCASAPNAQAPRYNWIVLSIEQDFSFVNYALDACTMGSQMQGSFSCFRATGSQYLGNPIMAATPDSVNGGIAPATTRLILGYDRVIVAGLALGVRFGAVVHGLGPRADGSGVQHPLPIHFEARAAYWFGADAFTTATFRPFAYIIGGAAQVDTKLGVTVTEDPNVPPNPNQKDNPPSQNLDAYRRMGQGFVGFGTGIMFAFTPAVGVVLDAKYMHLFPTSGNVLSPSLGVAVGF